MSNWKTITEMSQLSGLSVAEVRKKLASKGLYHKKQVTYGTKGNHQWRPTDLAIVEKEIAKKLTQKGSRSTYGWFWPYVKKVLGVE